MEIVSVAGAARSLDRPATSLALCPVLLRPPLQPITPVLLAASGTRSPLKPISPVLPVGLLTGSIAGLSSAALGAALAATTSTATSTSERHISTCNTSGSSSCPPSLSWGDWGTSDEDAGGKGCDLDQPMLDVLQELLIPPADSV